MFKIFLILPKLSSILDTYYVLPCGRNKYLWKEVKESESVMFMIIFLSYFSNAADKTDQLLFYHKHCYLFKENGRTIPSFVVQKHHKNMQICHHNIMLNQILATMGDSVTIHIPYVPNIPPTRSNLPFYCLIKNLLLTMNIYIYLY